MKFAQRRRGFVSPSKTNGLEKDHDLKDLRIVTKRSPTEDEMRAMLFGWRVVKHVKSNAIVYAGADRTIGVGAGQMSRVDSSRIAVWKAGERNWI